MKNFILIFLFVFSPLIAKAESCDIKYKKNSGEWHACIKDLILVAKVKKGDVFEAAIPAAYGTAVPVDIVNGKAKILESACGLFFYKTQEKYRTPETKSYVDGQPARIIYIGTMSDGRALVESQMPKNKFSSGADLSAPDCAFNKKYIISAELFASFVKGHEVNSVKKSKKQIDEEEITELVGSAK